MADHSTIQQVEERPQMLRPERQQRHVTMREAEESPIIGAEIAKDQSPPNPALMPYADVPPPIHHE